MNLEALEATSCYFAQCASFAPDTDCIAVMRLLESHEGVIADRHTREKHTLDLAAIATKYNKSGGLFGAVSLLHPSLQPDVFDYAYSKRRGIDPTSRPGGTWLSYLPKSQTLVLNSSVCFPDEDPAKLERVAVGLVQFMYRFAPILRPTYSFIDSPPEGVYPDSEFIQTGTVVYLCWANYFNPKIVAEVGEEFILDAPGWQSAKLSCGGILYVVTESFLDWHFGKHRAFVKYWRQAFPDIEEL